MGLHRNSFGTYHGGAVLVGCLVLVTLSLLRQATQPFVESLPMLAILMSVLVFVVPGAVAGAMAPRAWLWNIVMLGIFAGAFLTWQVGGFERPTWRSPLPYKVFLVLVAFSALGCAVGSLLGVVARRYGPLSRDRLRRP